MREKWYGSLNFNKEEQDLAPLPISLIFILDGGYDILKI